MYNYDLEPEDLATMYDTIEYYNKRYNLNATEAVKYYIKWKERYTIVTELYNDYERLV